MHTHAERVPCAWPCTCPQSWNCRHDHNRYTAPGTDLEEFQHGCTHPDIKPQIEKLLRDFPELESVDTMFKHLRPAASDNASLPVGTCDASSAAAVAAAARLLVKVVHVRAPRLWKGAPAFNWPRTPGARGQPHSRQQSEARGARVRSRSWECSRS